MDRYVIKGRLGGDQVERERRAIPNRDRMHVGAFYERGGSLTHISSGRRLLQAEK